MDETENVPRKTMAERIAMARCGIATVRKTQENRHHNYKYAGVDDVYAAARPGLDKAQLDLRTEVVSREMLTVEGAVRDRQSRKTAYVAFQFLIGFGSPEVDAGVEDYRPVTRWVTVLFAGPQTDEHAMSYVQKQFLRGRLLIATGDADGEETMSHAGPPPPEDPPYEPRITEEQAGDLFDAVMAADADFDRFLKYFGVEKLNELKVGQHKRALAMLKRKGEQGNGKPKPEAEVEPEATSGPAGPKSETNVGTEPEPAPAPAPDDDADADLIY